MSTVHSSRTGSICAIASDCVPKRFVALHVCYLTPDSRSGHETRIVEETGLLRRNDLEVAIGCFVAEHYAGAPHLLRLLKERLQSATGAMVNVIPTRHFFDPLPAVGEPGITAALERLVSKYGAHLVHGQSLYATMHALRARHRLGVPVVWDVRGIQSEETAMTGGRVASVRMLAAWEQQALHGADLRIFVSERMREIFWERYGEPVGPWCLIPSCVRPNRFEMPAALRQTKRSAFGLSDKFVVLYLGSLRAWQWPEAMFSLMAQLLAVRPNAFFYLIVPQADQHEARSLLDAHGIPNESCKLKEVPREQIGSVVGLADAGLLLRKHHPVNLVASPTKFAEYMAAGVPVIATPGIGDTSDLISRYTSGILVGGSSDGLGAIDLVRLVDFVDDVSVRRDDWAARCSRVAAEHLDWTIHVETLISAYRALLAPPYHDR